MLRAVAALPLLLTGAAPASSSPLGLCNAREGMNCQGDDIKDAGVATNAQQCCDMCSATQGCSAWTWNKIPDQHCWVKSSCDLVSDNDAVSGAPTTPAPPPAPPMPAPTPAPTPVPTPPPAPPVTPPPSPPAARFHCDKLSGQCVMASEGHTTLAKCKAACGAAPSPPVPPSPPAPPTPAPSACVNWYETTQHSANFRNVKAYGAKGDGVTDDTAAIRKALTDGRRAVDGLDGKGDVTQTAVVYLPAGTYLVSGELHMYYDTFIHGDPCERPKIVLAAGCDGGYVIGGPPSGGGNGHTNNFYYGVMNVDVDITRGGGSATAVHWPVSQGTYLRNMHFEVGNNMRAIYGEDGSGGLMADLTINGGQFGIHYGNQQWTFRNIKIKGAREACVKGNWNWAWTFVGVAMSDCPVGIAFDAGQSQVGTVVVVDSSFANVGKVYEAPAAMRVLLDNVTLSHVGSVTDGVDGGSRVVASWRQGPALAGGKPVAGDRGDLPATRAAALASRPRPGFGKLFNARDAGAKGDGGSDDTEALQAAVDAHDEVFLPHGTYLISATLRLRATTKLLGEGFTTLLAKAGSPAWANARAPAAMLLVPQDADARTQVVDFAFDSQENNPGCVMLDWGAGGDSGAWDLVWRVGGQYSKAFDSKWQGPHTLLRVSGGGYFENIWLWVADHDFASAQMIDTSIGHGLVVQNNTAPIWWYASASEHSMQEEYLFDGARDVVMVMGQTEAPYWTSLPQAPGLVIRNTTGFWLYGSAQEAWFSNKVLDHDRFQEAMIVVTGSENVYLYGPNSHNAKNIVSGDRTIPAEKYKTTNCCMDGFIANVPY